jgi:hypothetical protein
VNLYFPVIIRVLQVWKLGMYSRTSKRGLNFSYMKRNIRPLEIDHLSPFETMLSKKLHVYTSVAIYG